MSKIIRNIIKIFFFYYNNYFYNNNYYNYYYIYMSGSGASNIGYENVYPYNLNSYVNGTSSNYSGNFSSNEISGTPPGPLPGLAGAKNNINAAASNLYGISSFKGGAKKLKKKIKNITKYYKKMKKGSKKIKTLKKRLRSKTVSKKFTKNIYRNKKTKQRRHKQYGGYSQYQNNLPMTPSYSVGDNLPASQLALANPPPIKVLSNCVNCVDNYNRYTNNGFSSKGH